jgi:hypothetical protein
MENASTVIIIPFPDVEKIHEEISCDANVLPEREIHDEHHHDEHHHEQIKNDLTLQMKAKEHVYIPRDWAMSKLDQIKSTSTLAINTHVVPESVKAVGNVLSMEIKTFEDKVATLELHFFEDGIVKFNCVNPSNPSKFSFELIEKPANLTLYPLAGKVILENNQVEVTMAEVQAKVVVKFDSFVVTLASTKNNSQEVLFEINSNNSLKFDENLTADFTFFNEYLYGLPERASNLVLEDTKEELPYRFYNQDVPCYPLNSKNALYGTVPIIVSRSKKILFISHHVLAKYF